MSEKINASVQRLGRANKGAIKALITISCLFLTTLLASVESSAFAANSPRRSSAVKAIEKVMPTVVNIRTETVVAVADPFADIFENFWNPYYRQPRKDVRHSLGSGVLIHEDGYILTNDHVVRRASKIRIIFATGTEYDAERVAYAQRSDLALLRINSSDAPNRKFAAIPFARDNDLLLGEVVIALGNPFGLGGSVSQGILSSKARQHPREGEILDMTNWLQTDAAINPGNSGGPLINLDGELIGINVAIHREGQGIGFAIPIARVNESLGEFFTPEHRNGLWFGARVQLNGDQLLLANVESQSPAAKAGLRQGDIILRVNNRRVRDYVDWAREVARNGKHGIQLEVSRKRRRVKTTAHLQPEEQVFNSELIRERIGLTVRTLTKQVANQYGMSFYGGYLIIGVEANSPGERAGLEPGAVIERVDDSSPESIVAFARSLHHRRRGDQIRMNIVWETRRRGFIQRRSGEATVKIR